MRKSNKLIERISRAVVEGRLVDGRLVRSPGETPQCEPQWLFITPVPPTSLVLFQRQGDLARVMSEVIGRDSTNASWTISYQASATQHRIILPLVGNFVRGFLDEAKRTGVKLLMHASNLAVHEAHLTISSDMYTLMTFKHQKVGDAEAVLREQVQTVAQLLAPSFTTIAEGMRVPRRISVASVLPPELLELAPRGQFTPA
jgi:hypothetical protein